MTGLPEFWRYTVEMFRGTRLAIQAQRELRRARRLQLEGQYDRAFGVAVCAFGTLSELTARDIAPAASILATQASLLDELARQVGQPGAAREQLEQALSICQDVSSRSPKLQAKLQEYVAWYQHRLAEERPVLPN